jgi:hypothetical protein
MACKSSRDVLDRAARDSQADEMRLLAITLCLPLLAAGCQRASSALSPDAGPYSADYADRDHDGLCDASEAQLGSNPAQLDTDGDGFPDALEALAGTDLQDPNDPSLDHVAYFDAGASALDVNVAITATGRGQTVAGRFLSRNAADPQGRRASDFYQSLLAVSAEPPDNVRDIEPAGGRFGSLLDRARLLYKLHFTKALTDQPLSCAAGLPFDFMVEDETGQLLAREHYLLVVTGAGTKLKAEQFCRPVACI